MGSIKFICLNYCPKGERSDNYLPTYLQKNKINKQEMKTTKIINITLLAALLFAGCSKEEAESGVGGRIKLYAERLGGNNAKVFIPSTGANDATWTDGESIDLGGSTYTIREDPDHAGQFYLDIAARPTGALFALYPATLTTGGNDITVSNNEEEGCAVAIHKLTLNFHDGGYSVVFPMAARTDTEGNTLLFKHLTGALKITLTNNSGSPKSFDTLKVGATNASGAAIYKNLYPNGLSWGEGVGALTWNTVDLPAVPGGEAGEATGDVSACFVGEMTLVMKRHRDFKTSRLQGNNSFSLAGGETVEFCIPLLADSIATLTLKGYVNGNETPIFDKQKELPLNSEGKHPAIVRNTMYTIPEIVL